MPPPIHGRNAKLTTTAATGHYDTSSQSTRCTRDVVYRQFGFRIHSRPKNGGAIWERGGHYYSEPEMDGIVDKERKEQEKQRKELLTDLGSGG